MIAQAVVGGDRGFLVTLCLKTPDLLEAFARTNIERSRARAAAGKVQGRRGHPRIDSERLLLRGTAGRLPSLPGCTLRLRVR